MNYLKEIKRANKIVLGVFLLTIFITMLAFVIDIKL